MNKATLFEELETFDGIPKDKLDLLRRTGLSVFDVGIVQRQSEALSDDVKLSLITLR